jgi:hypothetical protein
MDYSKVVIVHNISMLLAAITGVRLVPVIETLPPISKTLQNIHPNSPLKILQKIPKNLTKIYQNPLKISPQIYHKTCPKILPKIYPKNSLQNSLKNFPKTRLKNSQKKIVLKNSLKNP